MASILSRNITHSICRRAALTNASRQIHVNSQAQNSWFGKLFRGPESSESPEETKPVAAEGASGNSAAQPPSSTITASTSTTPSAGVLQPRQKFKKSPLSSGQKDRRFQKDLAFMEPRLGRKPAIQSPLIRKSMWSRLLALSHTEEHLRKVMKLMPLWADMGNKFDASFSEAFIRRCLSLQKPDIALEVFGNFGKYNLPLFQDGARLLLSKTYDTQPLSFVITLTSLFDVYKLPPVTKDFSCCAMVVAACLKNKSNHAQVVGTALYPRLKSIGSQVGPQPLPKGQDNSGDMPRVWTSLAMKKIRRRLPDEASNRKFKAWVEDWNVKSGHVVTSVQT